MQAKDWTITRRFLVTSEGWKTVDYTFHGTLTEAHYAASGHAKELDTAYGGSHFWTVDIYNPEHPEDGSAVQLFHGRLI